MEEADEKPRGGLFSRFVRRGEKPVKEETKETSAAEALNNVVVRLKGSDVEIAGKLGGEMERYLDKIRDGYAEATREGAISPEEFLKEHGDLRGWQEKHFPTYGWEPHLKSKRDFVPEYPSSEVKAITGSEELKLHEAVPPKTDSMAVGVRVVQGSKTGGVTTGQASFSRMTAYFRNENEAGANVRLGLWQASKDFDYVVGGPDGKNVHYPKERIRGMRLEIPIKTLEAYLESVAKI